MNKFKMITIISILMIGLLVNYFILLPINLRYNETFIVFIVTLIILYLLVYGVKFKKSFSKYNGKIYEINQTKELNIIVLAAMLITFVYSISSSPLFFSKQYQKLIGNVKEANFTKDFSVIKDNRLPIIDRDLALLLGDKKLGSDRGMGSEFHVGNFSDLIYKGRMVSIAPLEYNDIFKWLNNNGTPGYIIVDKITGDVQLITELNNKKLSLKYMPSAFFDKDLKRHVYMNGHFDNKLFSYAFEIDEQGNPFWVIAKTKKTIGITGGDDVKSVITVNAVNGDVKEYKINEVPKWIDVVYPQELVLKQLDDWGYYVNGFWNTVFGERDIIRITSDSRRVYNNNIMYHYTGLTSSGADESTVGFAFINTKTKKTTFYRITGATEESAMQSAEGKVQNLRYKATFPLPLNLNNQPTFLITLKDAKGLIKQYAFVNIADYSIVGNGETIEQAKNSYLRLLNEDINIEKEESEKITGIVSRIGIDINNNETIYYMVLENIDGIYYGTASTSNEIPVTKPGDNINIEVNNLQIIKFDNLNIK
jgi:hypothetical protein